MSNKRLECALYERRTVAALRAATAAQAVRCTSERRLIQV